MMASIPNMRSAPLPLPAGPPSGEGAPGDFAARMPAVRGLSAAAVPPLPLPEGAEFALPGTGEAIPAAAGEAAPKKKAEAPDADPAQAQPPALVIPFLHSQPPAPGPQLPPALAAEAPPPAGEATAGAVPAAAGEPGRAAKGDGAVELPLPTSAEAGDDAPGPELAAAVKDLLQRKQALAKQAGVAPGTDAQSEGAKADPAAAQPPSHAKAQTPSTPAALQPALPLSGGEPVQPALAPGAPPVEAKGAGTIEGTRSTELAAARPLDVEQDAEWLDRLARDIARAGANDGPLRFRLHPQSLGHLHVELQQGDHGTAVRLTVETEAARQILADAQPRLAAEARAQGVRIAETHVDLSGSGRHAPGDQRRQDETRQTPLIRTARGAGPDAVASARPSARARLDRYA